LVSHTKGRTQIEKFKNRVLRRIFGLTREEVAGETEEDCIMRNCITCTLQQILLG
jgi:L-serine deaminase